jgi:hypothetical protein
MYAFLLSLGAVVAVVGAIIALPGLPFSGRDYDPSIITPGVVAVVGGFILIGLGLAVRALTRIEKALAARPLPRPVHEQARAAAPGEQPAAAPARVPFPPKPESRPQPALAAVAPSPVSEDAALERLREQFPTLGRLENAPVVEETDVSLLPKPPARVDEDVADANNTAAQEQAQPQAGGAAPARTEPRLELHVRPASRAERPRNFDAYWPKRQRPAAGAGRSAQAAPAVVAVQPVAQPQPVDTVLPAEPTQFQFREPPPEPRLVVPAAEAPAPISVLKSGVVDGMAYTLYSDGSIEAQLPQGTLRFGSITELRNHIEQSA